MTNAGQTCIAPDYVLAAPAQIAPLAEAFTAAVRAACPGGLADPGLTTIVDDRHMSRLAGLLEDARNRGGEILAPLAGGTGAHARAMSPALVLQATPEMAVMQEEIFGPILPVLACDSPEAAADFIGRRPHPLALYLYGHDRRTIDAVLARTTSGNVTVNGMFLHYAVESLPFGGVGESGLGAYHGIEGFRRLSHARGIFRPARLHPSRLLSVPHGRLSRLAARLMMR
jgi:coniferyl-aldehyde dehydrogenase